MKRLSMVVLALLVGCGGGSSDPASEDFSVRANLQGSWNVMYNIVVDECGLTEEDINSFDDVQTVSMEGDLVTVESSVLLTPSYSGATRGEDSFLAEAALEGDLFADGSFCSLSEKLSYDNIKDGSAESVYTVRLDCTNGVLCDSAVRGKATLETAG